MGKSNCFNHYKAFYIESGIALYENDKLVDVSETEEEMISYIRAFFNRIGYFIRRFKPRFQDIPVQFLLDEKHPELPPICESKSCYYGKWVSLSYNGKKANLPLTTDVQIKSSCTVGSINISFKEHYIESDPYLDNEDRLASMSEEEYEQYLRLKRVKV